MGLFLTSLWWDLVSIGVIFALTFITYFKWLQTYWSRRDVDTPETHFPFGNASKAFSRVHSFGEDLAEVYKQFKRKGLKYCGYYLVLQRAWLPLELNLIKDIMTKDFMHFTDHGSYTNEENDPLTGQLFMLNGTKWRHLRSKLTPTFTTGKMKLMLPTLLDCSRSLITEMDKVVVSNGIVDIKDIVARYTTDVIGSCAFGVDCNSLKDPNSEFRYYGKMVFEMSTLQAFKQLLATSFPWILDTLKIPFFRRDVIDFFLKIVKETVTYREKNNIVRNDFMHLLIQLKNNGNADNSSETTTLTIEQITAQAFVFFLAGFETSSTTLTFCLYEMVCNPNIQERMREEVNNVYAKYNGNLTYESLSEMKYMDRCIDETLRKYPPLPILMRTCTENYNVPDSDLVIEKGTRVFIPILGIQRDPEYYPDPEKFDPERFSQESKSERHPFAWLPFGEGPRICIGLRFGMMQTKVALSTLLKNYKFSLNKKTVTPLVMDPKHFVLSNKGGIWLNVESVS